MKHQQKVSSDILAAVSSVIGNSTNPVALHDPQFNGNEWHYVKECLDTGWVSSVGKFVDRFEQKLRDLTGAKFAVATVNGTSALHVALLLAGVQPDDEVLVPTMTFVATANAITYCGAIPHFIDSSYSTLGADPSALEKHLETIGVLRDEQLLNAQTGRIIRAIVPMHTFGHPVEINGLQKVCDRFNLKIIEDAAESVGSSYKGVHTGRFGLMGTFSFNGNKIITTGGGGAIVTDDPELGKRAKHLTTTARIPHRWAIEHDEVGYNYRMPNINAALGYAQIESLPRFLEAKRSLAQRYAKAFELVENAEFVLEPANTYSNYWLNAILLDSKIAARKDRVLTDLNDAGILARPCWTLMHKLPMYEKCPRADLQVAEDIESRLINLPSSVNLV